MSEPTIREIIEAAAETFNATAEQLLSERRARDCARPRQVAAYLARSLTAHSTTGIGRAMNRDHATILHATRVVENLIGRDEAFRERVERTRSLCRAKAANRPARSGAAAEIGEIAAALRSLGRDAVRAANMLDGLARRDGDAA